MHEHTTAHLVLLARHGDESAWRALVHRHAPAVWSVARSFRLAEADAADVCQATWLAFAEHLHRVREPERIAGWLITTARRESLRLVRVRGREEPIDLWHPAGTGPGPEDVVLGDALATALWRAFAELSEQCQRVLRLVACAPELTYAQVAEALGLRVGSVGPTRSRCVERLRRRAVSAGLVSGVTR
ncbi:RNA polymerase sigma factor [Umezawaea beigongshangensis]|uniref:RNA polymerase sigma factor n=1 Tax=Umezawaea beigongshangensis TaxID=2780383 RepID=UPI0018F1D370|nr:sigma-70 family RNA polymerase sigma factor [Umezawaea beigongshangensis]